MSFALSEALQQRLEQFVLASGLPSTIMEELLSHNIAVTYPEGATLFLQGDPADLLFWISSGVVEVLCPQVDGGKLLVRLCGPGEIVGYMDYMADKNHRKQMFEARARVRCEVVLFTRDRLRNLLSALTTSQLIQVIEYLNTSWSSLAGTWVKFIGLSYRQRLEVVFQELAERFSVHDARGSLLLMNLSHAQLAEMIGCSRPMITRLINEMIREGVLKRDRQRYILPHWSKSSTNGSARRISADMHS